VVKAWHRSITGSDGPGDTTAAKCYRLLRAILTAAVEEELIARTPVPSEEQVARRRRSGPC